MQVINSCSVDFNELFELHYTEMFWVAKGIVRRYDLAEDVVQDAYIKAYKNSQSLIDLKKKRAWLRQIVVRTAIDYYRKEKKQLNVILDDQETIERKQCDHQAFDTYSWKIEKDLIVQVIEHLPKKSKEILTLKWFFDYSDQRISHELNVNVGAVKTRLHRARKQFKAVYDQYN
ncbi:RNA polymerase sigma-70 factor, ECF subfamily [Pelagirhabdus alkalitolerans]|uniref:RNA polymerase sigma factor n=1 Tax=Pelagirhabdus alkalitolerans TaxID=1612202 RepID=A0A1G6H038_9BACI|nr:RNA polymerase sigma factor [Pelagirhabdus alkalitolerans]SDB86736.1 RNA polymerase sigma-70 factor, ECF subfamily [Pelagirhabdus alkalitolerans]